MRVREKKERKGATEYIGAKLTHILNLVQVTDAQDLPPVWEALARASKHQQLLVLQRAFDTTAEEMGLCPPTIATPSLLKLVLALGFRMESRDDLVTGLHPLCSWTAHGHGPQVPLLISGPLRYGGLQDRDPFFRRCGDPIGTRRNDTSSKFLNGPRAVDENTVDCWNLSWHGP